MNTTFIGHYLSVIASPFGRRSNLVHQERDRHSASRRIAMTKNVNTVTSQNTLLLPQVINKRLIIPDFCHPRVKPEDLL